MIPPPFFSGERILIEGWSLFSSPSPYPNPLVLYVHLPLSDSYLVKRFLTPGVWLHTVMV